MPLKHHFGERGLTLVEVTMATAIFAIVAGATATSLASFYVSMDIQEQRIEAVHSCQQVINALRDKRSEFVQPKDAYNWTGFLAWIQAQEDAHWADYVRDNVGHEELGDHAITVQCLNSAGAQATANDNPIEVHVTATWKDRKGRTMQAQIVSILTNL